MGAFLRQLAPHGTSSPRTRGSSALVSTVCLREEVAANGSTPLRVPPGKCAQRHAVRWGDVESDPARLAASNVGDTGIQFALSNQAIGLVRDARVDGVGDPAREADQEMESRMEGRVDRDHESVLAGSLVGHPGLTTFARPETPKTLDSRVRGNDGKGASEFRVRRRNQKNRHSRERGNPAPCVSDGGIGRVLLRASVL